MIIAFGPRWNAPETEGALWVATPAGEPCAYCRDPIELGDQGQILATIRFDGAGSTTAVHAGCLAKSVIGHRYGVCHCHGWPDTGRAGGDAVWRRLGHTPVTRRALAEWIGREPYDGDALELFDALRRRTEETPRP